MGRDGRDDLRAASEGERKTGNEEGDFDERVHRRAVDVGRSGEGVAGSGELLRRNDLREGSGFLPCEGGPCEGGEGKTYLELDRKSVV